MKPYLAILVVAVVPAFWNWSLAQAEEVDSTNATETVNDATDTIKVLVNKARMMRLDGNAEVVLVANPEIADVVIDSPDLIFLLGVETGETSLLILDENQNELLNANILVIASEEKSTASVQPTKPKKEENVIQVKVLRRGEQTTLNCKPRCE